MHHTPKYSPKWSCIRGATAISGDGTVLLEITAEDLRSLLKTASPIFTTVFEALMLQQYMHNALRTKA
jgi:CRP/FNR family transcriptional regulator, cyclic AMP receptor protein